MKHRTTAPWLFLILTLILPAVPVLAVETPMTQEEEPAQETAPKLTEEDRQVVEMLDLLEILELLNEFDNVTALEEKP